MTKQSNLRTPLYATHVALGARMVPFGGWDMPVQYSGILAEVKAVRTATGLFDVSHMGRLYISGPQAADFLDWVLTGSASTLRPGRARYCMICNEEGGVIDDTIFYRLADDRYLLIPNAGNRPEVVAWFQRWVDARFSGGCLIDDRTAGTALLAFQGPETPPVLDQLCDMDGGEPPSRIRPFAWGQGRFQGRPVLVGRTDFDLQDWSAHLPSVGGGLLPNLEEIVALSPDLVIRFHGEHVLVVETLLRQHRHCRQSGIAGATALEQEPAARARAPQGFRRDGVALDSPAAAKFRYSLTSLSG